MVCAPPPPTRPPEKHLVAIAPATSGSPLARQGRSWLGAVFKGERHLGPDFLAVGDAILDGLELASPIPGIWLAETSSTNSRFSMTVRIHPMCSSFAARKPMRGSANWPTRRRWTAPYAGSGRV